MHSSLLRSRSIAFDSADNGATLGGGSTATADESSNGDAGAGDEEGAEPEDKRPEWRKRLDAIAGKVETPQPTADETVPTVGKKPATPAAKPDSDGDAPIVVKLPGRKNGDADIELPLDRAKLKELGLTEKEITDRFGQLRNGFARKEEIAVERREIEAARSELAEIEREMHERPVDFFLDNVNASQYRPLVTALLTRMSDQDFNAVVAKVAEFDADGSRRRTEGSDSRDKQHERRETRERQTAAQRESERYVKDVTARITSVIPEDFSDEQADEVFEFATFKLQQYAAKERARGNTKGIAAEAVPGLLRELGVLSKFDISDADDEPAPRKPATPPSGRNAPPPKKPAASGKPRDTATELEERRNRRRDAASTPAGAGAAASSGPPKGQTMKERLDWVRKNLSFKRG